MKNKINYPNKKPKQGSVNKPIWPFVSALVILVAYFIYAGLPELLWTRQKSPPFICNLNHTFQSQILNQDPPVISIIGFLNSNEVELINVH